MSEILVATIILCIIILLIAYIYVINNEVQKPKEPPKKSKEPMHNPTQCVNCKKMFEQSPEYRDSTKCFDCINNHQSQDHLNVSYGNANLYSV